MTLQKAIWKRRLKRHQWLKVLLDKTEPSCMIVRYIDETYIEGGKPVERPWIMVAVAAVIQNPWAGQGFVEDLRSTILEVAPPLGEVMVPDLLETIGGADQVHCKEYRCAYWIRLHHFYTSRSVS